MTDYEFWECNLYLDRQITTFKETQFNNNICYGYFHIYSHVDLHESRIFLN